MEDGGSIGMPQGINRQHHCGPSCIRLRISEMPELTLATSKKIRVWEVEHTLIRLGKDGMWQALGFELAGVSGSGPRALTQREKIWRNMLFQHVMHNPVTPVGKGISGCVSSTH